MTLERGPENKFDSNAIRIEVHIHSISKKTVIGYVPNVFARELSKVMDAGVKIRARLLWVIGGYSSKETLWMLINIAI